MKKTEKELSEQEIEETFKILNLEKKGSSKNELVLDEHGSDVWIVSDTTSTFSTIDVNHA